MIEFGHGTHVGLRRDHNEDTYGAEPKLGVWLVADGMGGHDNGEIASAIARDYVIEGLQKGKSLAEAIRDADHIIIQHSQSRSQQLPMGTTLVVVHVDGTRFEAAWVGDSRVYLWDGEMLKQLTNDHSYVQELVEQGAISADQARTHPHRNVVTQALGVTAPEHLNVETVSGELKPGDRLLLCSDGLTEEVDDEGIATLLAQDISPQECVDQLINAALDGGGSDNITVVVVGNTEKP